MIGTPGDRGAEALLSGQPLTHLRRLDLHHHYLTEATQKRVRVALSDVAVNLHDGRDPEANWPYVPCSNRTSPWKSTRNSPSLACR